MIYKLQFSDKTEYYQAKNMLDLLQSFVKLNNEIYEFLNINEVSEVSQEEALTINVRCIDENPQREISLWDIFHSSAHDNFCLLATNMDY